MSSPSARASLPAIITAARAGALDHAWALFEAGGYDARPQDAAALAVKGRLLKDRARRLSPDMGPSSFAAAAAAYTAADAIAPQPYTRINVATLTLLGGDASAAASQAADLLAWIDRQSAITETPYFIAATRAEALLLTGDVSQADAMLARAIACDPDGWEDHAATLRQLAMIVAATGGDRRWLDQHRPPMSLHFAGHLGIAAERVSSLRHAVDAVLAEHRVGFGFGALAAGADLVIAEALIAAGAALHVVLPTSVDAFVAQSVAPYGGDWAARFDRCLAAAASLQTVTGVRGPYEPLATGLAADVAMGSAVLNAQRLESSAAQLLVIDEGDGPFGSGRGTARDGVRWAASGRVQHVIVAPRTAPVTASGAKPIEGRADRRLAAMLQIGFAGLDALDEGAFAEAVDGCLASLRRQSATLPVQPDRSLPAGNARIVAFVDPQAAWAYARAMLDLPFDLPLRIGGHYALAHWLDVPPALVGRGVAELGAIAAAAMPGVLTVSETLAAALFAGPVLDVCAEPIGEAGTIRLFAVRGQ